MDKNLVPFGKYKGQPMEVMKMDTQYCDWIAQQDWFRERYGNLYQVIINNFTEPTETPEHNKLQILFLDNKFCLNFFKVSGYCSLIDREKFINDKLKEYYYNDDLLKELNNNPTFKVRIEKQFEEDGWDVILNFCVILNDKYIIDGLDACVEIKPNLSDDYPAVLRQIKTNKSRGFSKFLVIDTFDAKGATFEQVKEIFAGSNITIIKLDNIKGEQL